MDHSGTSQNSSNFRSWKHRLPLVSLDDRLLMDHLLTPSFFVDKFKETFGLLGYYIQCLGNFFACFLLVEFLIDVVVIVLRGLEI